MSNFNNPWGENPWTKKENTWNSGDDNYDRWFEQNEALDFKHFPEQETFVTNVFDKNRVVMWIADNTFQKTYRVNNIKRLFTLPTGLKVINIKNDSEDNNLSKIIYWRKGKYHQTYVPKSFLSQRNDYFTRFSDDNFRNDIEHTLHRVQDLEGKDKYFDKLINFIKKNRNIKFSSHQAEHFNQKINWNLRVDVKNKPETIERLTRKIYRIYDPISINNKKYSKETLVIPLSLEWFKTDDYLKERYTKIWVNEGYPLNGFSGEGILRKREVDFFILVENEIFNLQKNIKSKKKTSEVKWILNIKDLSFKERFVFIFNDTWKQGVYDKYSSGIGIESSFGPFRTSPLLNVIIHELTVNSNDDFLLGIDTHVDVNETVKIWESIQKLDDFNLKNSQDVNKLYQYHSVLAILNLGVIIKIIAKWEKF